MKPRAEVAKFMGEQMGVHYELPEGLPKPYTHHYGYQELRALLDFIYGGPPTCDEERLMNDDPHYKRHA